MRILVTRPKTEAALLVERLEHIGHQAIAAPLTQIHPIVHPPAISKDSAFLATSANAFKCFTHGHFATCQNSKFYCIGDKTAKVGQELGLPKPELCAVDATSFLKLYKELHAYPQKLTYFAGKLRQTYLEDGLKKLDVSVGVVETYETKAASNALTKIDISQIDAVILMSPYAATLFAMQWKQHRGFSNKWPIAFCLSSAIAYELPDSAKISTRIPAEPKLDALLALLGKTS